ncbi:MAG: DUF3107 domain-containing protein [Actinomycetota bacterium]|nr:DUF3107 domain-containing protein [Actinomycetota bacterium]
MEIRIGFVDSPRELDLELEEADQAELAKAVDAAMADTGRLWWVTDKKGRRVGISASRVAYVVVGAQKEERRVGFGA